MYASQLQNIPDDSGPSVCNTNTSSENQASTENSQNPTEVQESSSNIVAKVDININEDTGKRRKLKRLLLQRIVGLKF